MMVTVTFNMKFAKSNTKICHGSFFSSIFMKYDYVVLK